MGDSAVRRSAQMTALSCGSKRADLGPAATARLTATVVFPTPPFWAMRAIVFTSALLHLCSFAHLHAFRKVFMQVCGDPHPTPLQS